MTDQLMSTEGRVSAAPSRRPRRTWNFTPDLPIRQAPYFEWPVNLADCARYIFNIWRPFNQRFLMLLAAVVVWIWFTPELSRARQFEWDWVLEIGLRNLVIMLIVAGGLHLLLYRRRAQEDEQRYDLRPMATDAKTFHFGDQVWDNMFWTLAGSVPIGTLWESVLLWAYANGHATLITFQEDPIWFVGLIFIIPIYSGFHFYWYHRLFHVRPLYQWFHSWHHKNINTGPWSGHAMHPVEHVFVYSDALIYFFVASHPIHVIFNTMLHSIAGPTSHCGYHRVKLTRFFSIELGDFMHQLHHRYFDCNYGAYESPWDKVFDSFHDGTPEGDEWMAERRRRMQEKRAGKS